MKPGSKDTKSVSESNKRIGILTERHKRRRISTENYIKEVHIALSQMANERDYMEYLSNIGQY